MIKNLLAEKETLEMWVQSHIPWKIPWKKAWNPLQYSCLENPKDRGAWRATVRGVAKSRTRLSELSVLPGLPRWLIGEEPTCQCWRRRSDPWVRKIPGRGNGNPLQYSCLENPRQEPGRLHSRGSQSRTRLSTRTHQSCLKSPHFREPPHRSPARCSG